MYVYIYYIYRYVVYIYIIQILTFLRAEVEVLTDSNMPKEGTFMYVCVEI